MPVLSSLSSPCYILSLCVCVRTLLLTGELDVTCHPRAPQPLQFPPGAMEPTWKPSQIQRCRGSHTQPPTQSLVLAFWVSSVKIHWGEVVFRRQFAGARTSQPTQISCMYRYVCRWIHIWLFCMSVQMCTCSHARNILGFSFFCFWKVLKTPPSPSPCKSAICTVVL